MFTLTGKYNTADVFTAVLEQTAVSQVMELLCQEFVSGSRIRIMPDAHAGAGCVIGTTMTLHGKVVANLVGVDVGCGVDCVRLARKPNFKELDQVIHDEVPSGFNIQRTPHRLVVQRGEVQALQGLRCRDAMNLRRAELSIGTLGGGNHFIEVDADTDGRYWLVVHSGSRNLGKQMAEYYQTEAIRQWANQDHGKEALIAELRAAGRAAEISDEIKKLNIPKIPKYLTYCEGQLFDDYLHDMKIVQEFAQHNRDAILDTIDVALQSAESERFTTVHNYIETGVGMVPMLRKGAVAAHAGQRLLIPINMRDGALLCRGKGNADWNESAPHGAGRLMGRAEAKRRLTVERYAASMKGIYTTCVGRSTLDEAPEAYKPVEEILAHINDTVEVVDTWKPVYNFKAAE